MPQLLIKKIGEKHRKYELGNKKFIIDFTEDGNFEEFNNSVKRFILENKHKKQILIIDCIYPITKLSKTTYTIQDHINLSGINPLAGPNFISLTKVYQSRNGIVVCGVLSKPNQHEKKVLLKSNVKAYCFNLVPTVIFAKSLGLSINATGIVKRIERNSPTVPTRRS